ncbi:MAG: Cytochrome c [Verrucomicrobiales bacterium]|nr:Cytochrome c [Verrucomicrobiales bacterium]
MNGFPQLTALALPLCLLLPTPAPAAGREPYNTETSPTLPLPPAEAAAKWKFPDGLSTTVFASEPEVRQPIALAVDRRGRLWVAECYTYSEHKTGWANDLLDRIVILEDTDGDGRHDKRTVFCEGLNKLTSIEIGFGGVWAITLPEMVFIPDQNGDDVPDSAPVVKLDGFEWKVNHHTVANGLRWGPDGWLYGRHGIQANSMVGAPGKPEAERLKMNVGIWRYHPRRGTLETVCVGTTNPWGMDWNEWGDAFFINTVIGHLWQVIPGAHYRRMYGSDLNPHVYDLIEQHADHVHWAAGEAWNDWQKLGTTDATSAAGGGHAHTGLLFYSGTNWPAEWRGKLLTINFNGRRLNVEDVIPEGSGYVGKRLPDTGFSADPWFRGIDLVAASDGGIFIADWSDTGECHDDSGVNRTSGRIYKINHSASPKTKAADFNALSPEALVPLLDAPDEFTARHARLRLQELAAAGHDLASIHPTLTRAISEKENPIQKLRALRALFSIKGTSPAMLRGLLANPEPHLRQWAIRLLTDDPAVLAEDADSIAALTAAAAREASPAVRLELASALQRLPVSAIPAIAPPLLGHPEDAADHNLPQMLWYGIESLGGHNPPALAALAKSTTIPLIHRSIARRLIENKNAAPALETLLTQSSTAAPVVQNEVLKGMSLALAGQRHVPPPAGWSSVSAIFSNSPDAAVRDQARALNAVFADPAALLALGKTVKNSEAALEVRRTALRALIDARADGLKEICLATLTEPGLITTAAGGLILEENPALADLILTNYPAVPVPDRPGLLSTLVARPSWAARVLQAVAENRLPATELTAFHARQIRGHQDAALTAMVGKVWGEVRDSPAAKLAAIAKVKANLTPAVLAAADREKGRILFKNLCATCHVLNGEGGRIGPELTGSNRDNLDYLLQNIGDPNSVVAKDYQVTTLTMNDARVLTGFIRSRNEKTLTLQTLSEVVTLPLGDIAKTETAAISLMPDGLLEALDETSSRDLFGYLMAK